MKSVECHHYGCQRRIPAYISLKVPLALSNEYTSWGIFEDKCERNRLSKTRSYNVPVMHQQLLDIDSFFSLVSLSVEMWFFSPGSQCGLYFGNKQTKKLVALCRHSIARCKYIQDKKRQLIEFDALSDHQSLIIIIRQCWPLPPTCVKLE